MANQLLVRRRLFGEVRDIREFIQPDSAAVQMVAATIPEGDPWEMLYSTWKAVTDRITYPSAQPYDYHFAAALAGRGGGGIKVWEKVPMLRQDATNDYWNFPAESLAMGVDDCEGTSFTVCSILRHWLSPQQVYVLMGLWRGKGWPIAHAWVQVVAGDGSRWRLETTQKPVSVASIVPDGPPYEEWLRFNDVELEVLRPGLVEDNFQTRARIGA